jgi:hypothetical protein
LHKVKTRKLSDSIVKALRQALSLQKVHKDKEGMAPGVATALNFINNLLLKEGANLNGISGITIDESLTKARAKRARLTDFAHVREVRRGIGRPRRDRPTFQRRRRQIGHNGVHHHVR